MIEKKKFHSTQKPIKLMERLKCSTNEGDTVINIFSGSGSTAFFMTRNRNFVGCEVDGNYQKSSEDKFNQSTR